MSIDIKTYRINTWKEYVNITLSNDFVSWAFRGQADSNWPLESTLSRYLKKFKVHPDAWTHQEERIIRIFKRKAHHYLDTIPPDENIVEWLSIMQHHGTPTRIIDFTWSPFVASFFALHRASKKCAIWAINPAAFDYQPELSLKDGRKIEPRKLWPNSVERFQKYFLKDSIPFVVQGEPNSMNDRLIAQSGTFAIPSILDKTLDEIFSLYENPKNIMVKFELDTKKIRDEAMGYFHVTNINESTLFPGIDGMARSLAYELEYHWAYNPKSMRVIPGYETPPFGLPDNVIK